MISPLCFACGLPVVAGLEPRYRWCPECEVLLHHDCFSEALSLERPLPHSWEDEDENEAHVWRIGMFGDFGPAR